jgi:hypothetical protein
MNETMKAFYDPENEREITERETDEIAGGLNPQPEPPGKNRDHA